MRKKGGNFEQKAVNVKQKKFFFFFKATYKVQVSFPSVSTFIQRSTNTG